MRTAHQTSFSLWWIWGALAVALAVHVVIYRVTTSTSYAICLSKAKIIGPSERHLTLARTSERLGISERGCCSLSKDAGEFKLGWKQYMESGVIWSIKSKLRTIPPGQIGFLTNFGQVLTESEYLQKYVI